MKMLPFFCILYLCIGLLACDSDIEIPYQERQWTKVEIVGEHAPVYSMYGSINDVMIVTLYGKILKTEDGGKTWQEKLNVTFPTFGSLKMERDTLFAIAHFDDYFSLNNGETWQALSRDLLLPDQTSVTSAQGYVYQIQQNSNGELGLPSDLLESCDGGSNFKNVFPYQHGIYSIHLNEQNELYVGINNSSVWNRETGSFDENLENNAAFYYSKK